MIDTPNDESSFYSSVEYCGVKKVPNRLIGKISFVELKKKMFDETHTDAIPDISSQAQGWIVDELCVSLSAQTTK